MKKYNKNEVTLLKPPSSWTKCGLTVNDSKQLLHFN